MKRAPVFGHGRRKGERVLHGHAAVVGRVEEEDGRRVLGDAGLGAHGPPKLLVGLVAQQVVEGPDVGDARVHRDDGIREDRKVQTLVGGASALGGCDGAEVAASAPTPDPQCAGLPLEPNSSHGLLSLCHRHRKDGRRHLLGRGVLQNPSIEASLVEPLCWRYPFFFVRDVAVAAAGDDQDAGRVGLSGLVRGGVFQFHGEHGDRRRVQAGRNDTDLWAI